MYAVIREANRVRVCVGTFKTWEEATEWAKANSSEYVGCEVVSFYSPERWRNWLRLD